MARRYALLLGLLLVCSLSACDGPLVGEWRSDKKLGNDKRNSLSIASDSTGTATIYATPASDHSVWTAFEFNVSWGPDAEEFDLAMNCARGPCDNNDFVMECIVIDEQNGETEKLECDARGNWQGYVFDWERREE
ncbi:MAG: hypothetical protein EXR75_13255 [Myxococcales bacterium]|nr:hypothetical protein [Myxococcales bacterium]